MPSISDSKTKSYENTKFGMQIGGNQNCSEKIGFKLMASSLLHHSHNFEKLGHFCDNVTGNLNFVYVTETFYAIILVRFWPKNA